MLTFSFVGIGLRVAGFEEDSDGASYQHHLRESEEKSHAGEFDRDCEGAAVAGDEWAAHLKGLP